MILHFTLKLGGLKKKSFSSILWVFDMIIEYFEKRNVPTLIETMNLDCDLKKSKLIFFTFHTYSLLIQWYEFVHKNVNLIGSEIEVSMLSQSWDF